MLDAWLPAPTYENPVTNPKLNIGTAKSPSVTNGNAIDSRGIPANTIPLSTRLCSQTLATPLNQAAHFSLPSRKEVGGKGMFLYLMQALNLSVPPFKCVTTQIMNGLEQHPLEIHRLAHYIPDIVGALPTGPSLANIREYLNALPPAEQAKRNNWLAGLAEFVASSDFYQQVKASEAARQIRALRSELGGASSQPVIVRSSGVNEDNYGDAQAGKYLSEVQGEDDVLRTCLRVMASGYRPELCPGGIPQPMALIIQHCIDCQSGGVATSFQSPEDNTIRVEFTLGQPRGAVAGQSGITPHRIDIARKDGKTDADNIQYFPGSVSSRFILRKNRDNNGYTETPVDASTQPDGGGYRLTDHTISLLTQAMTLLEDLLLCPVDVEFAIDRQGRLFLLQVRPVTRLSGGMDFAMPIPEETLARGEGISEGYGTGTLWRANQQAADTMPEEAIVVAPHAEEWMLETKVLERARAFVVAAGGSIDHVAIQMRQINMPLMVAKDQYPALAAQVGQQATLACARFNGKPDAFVVAGDLTGKLASHGRLSPASSDQPLATAFPSWDDLSLPEGTFREVTRGFQWLTDQNARLLALFAPGGGLDCLANPVTLSMSPQRARKVAETRDSVNRLIHGAQALLDGYEAFLLAGNRPSDKVQPFLDEFPQLNRRFMALKRDILSGVEGIIRPLQAGEALQPSEGRFRQWLATCHQLQSSLQALHPADAEQVQSVHDLIFALHQRFVKALAPVTLASAQGRISGDEAIEYVDCTVSGNPDEKAPLLSPSCKALIEKLGMSGTVIIMDDVLIVNLEMGNHMCLIELFEDAEGGKERTLRLKFSDQHDDIPTTSQLKRMWFLVQLLKALELDKNADSMKLRCNAVVGEIIVECNRMESRKTMLRAFQKVINALSTMYNVDYHMWKIVIFEGDQWNFSLLAQRLNGDVAEEAERFAFQHCLFTMYYKKIRSITTDCFRLLPSHHQKFIHYGKRLAEFRDTQSRKKSRDNFREILMSNEITEETRRELLHHLLFLDAESFNPLVEDVYLDLRDQCYVLKPLNYGYKLGFDIPPSQSLSDNREKVKKSLLKNGLEYGSQRVRNDKDLVLSIIAAQPKNLKFAGEKLRDNKEVVMTAINQHGVWLRDVGPKMKDNEEVVKAAIAQYPRALCYASERLRSDKSIIQIAIDQNIQHLDHASEKILNDREYLLNLIKHNPLAFLSVARELQRDMNFIGSAIDRNQGVVEHVDKEILEKFYSTEFTGSQYKKQKTA